MSWPMGGAGSLSIASAKAGGSSGLKTQQINGLEAAARPIKLLNSWSNAIIADRGLFSLMIGFLPTKYILTAAVSLAIAIFAGLAASGRFTGIPLDDIKLFAKFVLGIPAASLCALYIAWRAVPLFQRSTFPYLGGRWTGVLRYGAPDQQDLREAVLVIKHGLSGMSLVLDSRESESTTLAVVATRDPTSTRFHVYYVFENRRKPAFTKPGYPVVYRGVAIMSLRFDGGMQLSGEYFTDQPTRGIAEFKLEKSSWF
jgi:hypothetical protein